MIKHFSKNVNGRDFFVGDIHGCFNLLEQQMQKQNFNPLIDRIFSVGDLVDRGEQSIQALDWIAKPFFHAVRGNHEDMAIRWPLGNMDRQNYERNGGAWMVHATPEAARYIADALDALPYMIEVETENGLVGVIHAEVYGNDWNVCKQNLHRKVCREQVLWGRDVLFSPNFNGVDHIDIVVVGHTPVTRPVMHQNVFYIDTGACFNGNLTFTTL
jgi:serine/threonine protein phosphatase 1